VTEFDIGGLIEITAIAGTQRNELCYISLQDFLPFLWYMSLENNIPLPTSETPTMSIIVEPQGW